MSKRRQINLKLKTWKQLEEWKSPGQSFDGAVTELLQKQSMEVKAE